MFPLVIMLPEPQCCYLSQDSQANSYIPLNSMCILSVDKIMISYMCRVWNESATEDTIYNVARSEYDWEFSLVWGDSSKSIRLEIANEPFVTSSFNSDLLCGKARKEYGA